MCSREHRFTDMGHGDRAISFGAVDPIDHRGGEGHSANPGNLNLYYQLYHSNSSEEGQMDRRHTRHTQMHTA